jgi:hypothetical protein
MAGDFSRLAEEIGTALLAWARSSSVASQIGQYEVPSTSGSADIRGILIAPTTTLVFDVGKPQLDLYLPTLAHSLSSASNHAHRTIDEFDALWDWVLGEFAGDDWVVPRTVMRKRANILRNLVTMHDSLSQLAQLAQGQDLDGSADAVMRAVNHVFVGAEQPESAAEEMAPPATVIGPVDRDEPTELEVAEGEDWETHVDRQLADQQRQELDERQRRTLRPHPEEDVAVEVEAVELRLAHVYNMVRNVQRGHMHPSAMWTSLQEILDYIKDRQEVPEGE